MVFEKKLNNTNKEGVMLISYSYKVHKKKIHEARSTTVTPRRVKNKKWRQDVFIFCIGQLLDPNHD